MKRMKKKTIVWLCALMGEESKIGKVTLENRRKVEQLVKILQMMENPEPSLLDLLDDICDRFSTEFSEYSTNILLVSCSRHSEHWVSHEGFYLLELAEGAMGTSLQKAKEYIWCAMTFFEKSESGQETISSLISRVVRQKQPLQRIDFGYGVTILDDEGYKETLLQNTREWRLEEMLLSKDFGEIGWSWLAKRIQSNMRMYNNLSAPLPTLLRGKKEDLKAVWDVMVNYDDDNDGIHYVGTWSFRGCLDQDFFDKYGWETRKEFIEKENGEVLDVGWKKIEEIIY